MSQLNDRHNFVGQLYLYLVIIAGTFAVLNSLRLLFTQPVPSQWFLLAALTLLSGSFTVRIPGIPARLSVSDTFVFTSALMFGPAAATMLVVLDTLVIMFWRGPHSNPFLRVLFNLAAPSFAIWAACNAFYFGTALEPLSISPLPVISIIFPLLGLATVYFLLNSLLIATAVGIHKQESPLTIWKHSFLPLSISYYSGASVAALLLPYLTDTEHESLVYLPGLLLPLLLVFYLTFKTTLGRVEDANNHLSQLNKLYLSTVETLAMAIDAKDQITHGHIRRVQRYAIRLARHLGVTERSQISAIEAASLLHDMGKLAVPEYILNKPGRLTPAEFEKMKLHASVGADILSAIDFPYPVIPIVRHHHENWDGTGYPDGLRGTDIPIGARILSVVDCFDALTSDRPYRPKLSDSEAIRILVERRASMYDPLIVDAFIAVHSETGPADTDSLSDAEDLARLIGHTTPNEPLAHTSRFEQIASSAEEMLILYELANDLTGSIRLSDAGDVISKHLRRMLPASTCVFYIYEPESDDLFAAHAVGDNASQFCGLRICRGQRLTGWVAANNHTIVNSDPVLDLGEMARTSRPRLRSSLSTPLLTGDQLVGVLTLYSSTANAFSEDHQRIIEIAARQVSRTMCQAVESERNRSNYLRDNVTGLPHSRHLKRLIHSEMSSLAGVSLALLTIDLLAVTPTLSSTAADLAVERIAISVRKGLRGGDLLFQHGKDELLVLLPETDSEAASGVAARLLGLIIKEFRQSRSGDRTMEVTIGTSSAPNDGLSIETLVQVARGRSRPASDGSVAIH